MTGSRTAADIGGRNLAAAGRAARAYGLHLPVRGENWPFPTGGSGLSDFERSRRAAAGEQPPQDATHEPAPKRGRAKGNGAATAH